MKYLITESQLDKVIFKYLNYQDFVLHNNKKKYNNYIYLLNNITDDVAQISIYGTNAFGEVRNWVFVNDNLIKELTKFFPIDEMECLEIIKRWVSNVFSMEVGKIENSGYAGNQHRIYVV